MKTRVKKKIKDVPQGWKLSALGEFVAKRTGSIVPKKTPDDIFELYSVPSHANDMPEIINGKEIGSNKQVVQEGTVLLCKINPRINRSWVVSAHTEYKKIASTEWITFPPNDEFDPKYLEYYLKQDLIRDFLSANASGVGGSLMRVKPATIQDFPFPLAPKEDQRKIVAEIEKQFSRLDEAVTSLKRAKANLKRYKAAVLKAAVEGKLTEEWRKQHPDIEHASELLKRIQKGNNSKSNLERSHLEQLPAGWCWINVDQVAKVATGATPLRSNKDYYESGSIPWITSGALNDIFVSEANEFVTQKALKETNVKLFPAHTLLIAMYGEGKTRGKVSELLIEAGTNQACSAVIFSGEAEAIRPYLKLFFQKNYDDIRRRSSGGVQPNLNLGIIKNTQVPLPPLKEQKQIIAEVERVSSNISGAAAETYRFLMRVERLNQAILRAAFSGTW